MSNKIFTPGKDLHNYTTYQVGAIESAAHRALRQHKDELLKGYDLTGMDWYIIGAVADAGSTGIRTTDLAKKLGTTMGFLTKSTNLLEAKGVLQKRANATDARSYHIVLNKKYGKTVEEIEQALRAKLRKSIYSMVEPAELETYIRVIEKFSQLK